MSWPEEKPKEDGLTSLASGESLLPGQYIVSPNDTARLTLEDNGCLTIFKLQGKPTVLTGKKVTGSSLNNQEDGNLVLANDAGEPAGWATETAGGEGAYVTVTDEGVLQYTGADGVLLWDSKDGKPKTEAPGAPAPGSAEEAALAKAAPPPPEEPARKLGEVVGEGNGQVVMQSVRAADTKNAPVEFVAEIKETWQRDGRQMYKIETYITNQGAHNIVEMTVAVPHKEVVYETWGCHDRGEDSGERILELPLAKRPPDDKGVTAGECYNFGGVYSMPDPGFYIKAWAAPH
jgi:hypothetical protein